MEKHFRVGGVGSWDRGEQGDAATGLPVLARGERNQFLSEIHLWAMAPVLDAPIQGSGGSRTTFRKVGVGGSGINQLWLYPPELGSPTGVQFTRSPDTINLHA